MSRTNGGENDHDEIETFTSAGGRLIDVDPELLGFSKVEFIKHCLDQMRMRGISEDEVLRTIRGPHRKGISSQPGRERWRRNRGVKRAVDVVFEKLSDRIRVITAIVIELD